MSKRMTVIFEDEGLYTALKVEAARKCCATHKAVGWSTHEATADAPARMVLYWTAPERVEGYAPLPFAAGQGQIAVIVQGWLDSVDCGTEPDHDGDNAKGFRLYNEGWGHVESQVERFGGECIAVRSVSTEEASMKLGKSVRRVLDLCAMDRIVGAHQVERRWRIPLPIRIRTTGHREEER